MCYSIEPSNRKYVKGYEFFSFAKNIGTHATKIAKSMSNKYSQKRLNSAKISTTDAIKNASKRAIQKTAEETGDLTSKKVTDKITSISKSPKEFYSNKFIHKMLQKNCIQKQIRMK